MNRTRRILALGALALVSLVVEPGVVGVSPAQAADHQPGRVFEDPLVGYRFRPLNEWARIPQGTDTGDPKVAGFYSDKAKFAHAVKPECEVFAFLRRSEEEVLGTKDRSVATGSGKPTTPPADGGDAGGGGDGDGEDGPPVGPSGGLSKEEMERMIRSMRYPTDLESLFERLQDRYKAMVEQAWNSMDKKDQAKKKERQWRWVVKEKEFKGKEDSDPVLRVVQVDTVVPLTNGDVIPLSYIAGVIQNDDYQVVALYQLPEDTIKKYTPGAVASVRTLEFMDQEEILGARKDLVDALAGKTGDERWLEMIKRKVAEGWDYLQTKNYLLIYDKTVKPDRVKLIALQIEAIRRDIYEKLFPPDRPITAISVVRVCKDKNQYHQYGGPGGSAGYWNSGEKELVFYEDTSAKKDALRVLNHEAFHQYIFYSVGSISPHDWFNEGHGDYFSGHNYSPASGKFVPKPFSWRADIKSIVGSKQHVPLRQFVTMSHAEYYGPRIGANYSQGWSFIWFLRQQRNPEWQDILPTYFSTLKGQVTEYIDAQIAARKAAGEWKEGDTIDHIPDAVEEKAREAAIQAAFGKFDDRTWDRFEKQWKEFL